MFALIIGNPPIPIKFSFPAYKPKPGTKMMENTVLIYEDYKSMAFFVSLF